MKEIDKYFLKEGLNQEDIVFSTYSASYVRNKDIFEAGYKTAEKELYTKEDIYNCLGAFAYKYGITINGNDLDKWIRDRKL